MPLLARLLPAPLTVDVRRGAIADLGALLADRRIATEGRVAVALGPGEHGDGVAAAVGIGEAEVFRVEDATVDTAVSLGKTLRAGSYEAVAGIGGGRTIDVTKFAASMAGIPMVSVATNLSHDGIASPTSSLEHESGKGSYGVAPPVAVIVDLDSVHAAPDRVWPWLAQMGPAPRGGAYTYDWIENLMGLNMHSADRVLPEFQHPEVGETIAYGKNRMRLERVDPGRVLSWRSEDGNWVWTFVLAERSGATRLISRNRFRLPTTAARLGMIPMEPASLVMERKMLQGIKLRAERLAAQGRESAPA